MEIAYVNKNIEFEYNQIDNMIFNNFIILIIRDYKFNDNKTFYSIF